MNQPEIVEMLVRRDAKIAELQEEVRQLREAIKAAHEKLLMNVYTDLPASSPILPEVRTVLKDLVDIINK